jgi:preprotein translocase subunit SecA
MVIEKLGQIGEGRKKKQLAHVAELVNTYEPEVEDLSDAELAGKTAEFRERLESGETLDDRAAALRRPGDGRGRAAPGQHRRDEDR